jgi:alkanesulfonate monooxygenase SsuD/methylene tetrahydromethanopterin reductase-like flavin-dependent oxidoreductase (luciferase family)
MRVSLFMELPLPRPWSETDELEMYQDALDEVALADELGFSTIWVTEHHFMEEYCHLGAPEIFLAAASQRTENIRLGHGIVHMPPAINHPARVAERIAGLDLVSRGRVEFGTGEASSAAELEGFGIDPAHKREMWDEATRVALRCMVEEPFSGVQGRYVQMPPRNVVPKPLQKPHPPVWVACTRMATMELAAERGLGALGFSFVSPEDMTDRVANYYKIFAERCVPMAYTVNPNVLGIAGSMPLMWGRDEDDAVRRLADGGGFFGFSSAYYYNFGRHTPARSSIAEAYAAAIKDDPLIAYGPDQGPVGTTAQMREWCRRYEASGIDEAMFLMNPRTHEATMESIEKFGREVLPEFLERDEQAAAEKARRLEPLIEEAMRRRPADEPPFDENYQFGGVPVSHSTGYVADEAVRSADEITAARERDRERRAMLENLGRREL